MADTAFGQWWEDNIYNPGRNIFLGEDNGVGDFGQGLQNAFYNLTGQKEKTSTYQYELALENEKNQRMAADLEAAGLSKYGMTGSAPGSSFQGSEPTGQQALSGMIDMMKSIAEISHTKADTEKLEADAAATTAGIERDDKYYDLAEEKQGVELIQIQAETDLAKKHGDLFAQEAINLAMDELRAEELHVYELIDKNVSNQLKYKDLNSYDERFGVEMQLKRSSTFLNQQYGQTQIKEREKIEQQIKESVEKVSNLVAERMHLSWQDTLLLQDVCYAQLRYDIAEYDYEYSQRHSKRTTSNDMNLFGLNVDQLSEGLLGLGKGFTSGISNLLQKWSNFVGDRFGLFK